MTRGAGRASGQSSTTAGLLSTSIGAVRGSFPSAGPLRLLPQPLSDGRCLWGEPWGGETSGDPINARGLFLHRLPAQHEWHLYSSLGGRKNMGQRCARPTKPEIFPRGPLTEPGGPALPRHGESDRPHPSTRTVLGREGNAVPNRGVTGVAWWLTRVRVS